MQLHSRQICATRPMVPLPFLMKVGLSISLLPLLLTTQSWEQQQSGTTASLRGIHAVSDRVAWASGTGGTYLRTTDAGVHWRGSTVPGAEALDFRDVHAVDEQNAYLLSRGARRNEHV